MVLPVFCGTTTESLGKSHHPEVTTVKHEAETLSQWNSERQRLINGWMQILGAFPSRVDLQPHDFSVSEETDHLRKLVRYQTEPGVWTDAYLLIPKDLERPAPAAVVFHATSKNHILQPVGLADPPTRHLALHLVRRGYITLSPRCYIYGSADESATTVPATPPTNVSTYTRAANDLLARRPGWTGMGKMLWDGMRAVDFLESLPEVDKERIITIGHSLGAKQALYLVAFDERIRGAISSEGGLGLAQSNWNAPWYLGDRAPDPAQRDHDELLQLAAPRSVIIMGGESADGTKSRPFLDRARATYSVYGKPGALLLHLHTAGHDIPDQEREKALDQLEQLISGNGNSLQP